MSAPQPRTQAPGVAAIVAGVLLVAIGAQAWQAHQQEARIDTLSAEVRTLERSLQDARRDADSAPGPSTRTRTPSTAERPVVATRTPWAPPPASAAFGATRGPERATATGDMANVATATIGATRTALLEVLQSDDPEVRARVQAIIERSEAETRDQRSEARQQRWEQDALARIDKLATETHMTRSQQDALFALLTVARDRASDAFREARENQNFGEAREKADAYQTEADTEARKLLNDSQYAGYERMRDEEAERRGFRRNAPAR